ncbi:hypothetical protein [Sorangium sp. So ce131]|uniref:hypothetical protein n=1 Tax=Sorangium sp. So ce131 TaxID=3133282 RepID=UPI003F624315
MRRFRLSSSLVFLLGAVASSAGVAGSCSATGTHGANAGGGGDDSTAGTGGDGGAGTAPDGLGGNLDLDGGNGGEDVAMNPCGSACGPTELCNAANIGLDDDCDGEIDETCHCTPGQASSCFRGDPSFRDDEGCFPGTQLCDETGTWGACVGGVHADEGCFGGSVSVCRPLQAPPFADVDLKEGTGPFSDDAVPGTEVWTVTCPAGIDPCPAVSGADPADDFKPLQSGEYTVTYTKGLRGGGTESCEYPLFVGARGLRVELEWEHDQGSADLDLHLHQPGNTQPWLTSGSPFDCGWGNCTIEKLSSNRQIRWFSDSATPPAPVNWFFDSVESNNTCFYAPRGVGEAWRDHRRGCHNPRLDLDNVKCNPAITDPNDDEFCAPENINIDFPPRDQWMRIGVHYYGQSGVQGDVHPRIKIFCNSALGADLGPTGFYSPERPVAFARAGSSELFWLVADVLFKTPDECGQETCVVQPLYEDALQKTPLLTTEAYVESNFGPDYPPVP